MKKRYKILIASLIVLACIGGIIFGISIKYPDALPYYWYALNSHKRAYLLEEDFSKCYDDFEIIANLAMEYEDAHGIKKKHYLYFDDTDGTQLYDSDTDAPIIINEQLRLRLANINEAFQNHEGVFERVDVNEHYVMFEIENDRFAVVYSRDGSKPKSIIGLEDRGYSFYTRKVRDNWYFVTGTSGG